jgi:hypothetical protein
MLQNFKMDPEEQGKNGFMDIAVDLKIPDRVKVKHRSITLRSISFPQNAQVGNNMHQNDFKLSKRNIDRVRQSLSVFIENSSCQNQ